MGEIKYVLKCLLFTIVILLALQIKVGNRTLESIGSQWMRDSQAGIYLQNVGAGGALALKNLATTIKEEAKELGSSLSESINAKAEK